jgi:hypothetical protein
VSNSNEGGEGGVLVQEMEKEISIGKKTLLGM